MRNESRARIEKPGTRGSICIFGSNVCSALQGNIAGGAELQMALLARALSQEGLSVTIVDPEIDHDLQFESTLVAMHIPGWHEGLRGLRVITRRIPRLLRLLRTLGAQLYCTRGVSFLNLAVFLAARLGRARFALAIANDTDVKGLRSRLKKSYNGIPPLWSILSTILPNEIALFLLKRFADVLFVQNAYQLELARHINARVKQFSNLVDEELFNVTTHGSRNEIVVVGKISARKSLQYLVPVVQDLQEITFNFIGEVEDVQGEQVKKCLSMHKNVVFHGDLNRTKTLQSIANAKALLNTSLVEGFPNTFLEAWALGTPVISLFVDPGGVISANCLGYVCEGNVELMKALIQQSSYDVDLERCRQYVMNHHSKRTAVRIIRSVLNGQLGRVTFV